MHSNNPDPVRTNSCLGVRHLKCTGGALAFRQRLELEARHEWSECVAFWTLQVTGAVRLESVGELADNSLGVTDGGIRTMKTQQLDLFQFNY